MHHTMSNLHCIWNVEETLGIFYISKAAQLKLTKREKWDEYMKGDRYFPVG